MSLLTKLGECHCINSEWLDTPCGGFWTDKLYCIQCKTEAFQSSLENALCLFPNYDKNVVLKIISIYLGQHSLQKYVESRFL
jgi:hypothetical protein